MMYVLLVSKKLIQTSKKVLSTRKRKLFLSWQRKLMRIKRKLQRFVEIILNSIEKINFRKIGKTCLDQLIMTFQRVSWIKNSLSLAWAIFKENYGQQKQKYLELRERTRKEQEKILG